MPISQIVFAGTYGGQEASVTFVREPELKRWRVYVMIGEGIEREYYLPRSTRPGQSVAQTMWRKAAGKPKRKNRPTLKLFIDDPER